MRFFQQIAANVDVLPLLHQIQRQPELWNLETVRTNHPNTAHSQVDDILLRFNDLKAAENSGDTMKYVLDQHESINYPGFWKLSLARPLVFNLMRFVEGERLGRVIVTRLAPGKSILPHVDGGDHAAYYDRYHITLQNQPGSMFRAGNETVYMAPGDIWWFNNGAEHGVINNSKDDRITLIVDIRTPR